jgi:methylmalonyl-CoA decarboxylase
MPQILKQLEEGVGTITFNNSSRRNVISRGMVEEVTGMIDEFVTSKARVVILRAVKGSKVWSAGHDVGELPLPGRDPISYHDPLTTLLRAVQLCPVPVIAMLEGSAWGGACNLALSCDILIGTPTASLCMTPAKIGVPYNASGLLHFMGIMGVNIVKELFFTARPLSAERAYQLGIINHLVAADELETFTYDMARGIVRNSPLSISVIKEQIRLLANAHPLSPDTFERTQSLRRLVYNSADYLEGINAFNEKRTPVFRGE